MTIQATYKRGASLNIQTYPQNSKIIFVNLLLDNS
jgi:hypothetical protein